MTGCLKELQTLLKWNIKFHWHSLHISLALANYRHRSTVEIVLPVKTVSSAVPMNIHEVLCMESTLLFLKLFWRRKWWRLRGNDSDSSKQTYQTWPSVCRRGSVFCLALILKTASMHFQVLEHTAVMRKASWQTGEHRVENVHTRWTKGWLKIALNTVKSKTRPWVLSLCRSSWINRQQRDWEITETVGLSIKLCALLCAQTDWCASGVAWRGPPGDCAVSWICWHNPGIFPDFCANVC